jgi:hypothetical protein
MDGNGRTEELNQRLSQRNIPSGLLQPQFAIRPLSTKYEMMTIFDRRPIPTVEITNMLPYNVDVVFNPGTAQGPWNGFAANINEESKLRNQFFALQRGAHQASYIPPSNSDMYVAALPQSIQPAAAETNQPFPSLFETPTFEPFNPSPKNLGINLFDNCTRQQLNA